MLQNDFKPYYQKLKIHKNENENLILKLWYQNEKFSIQSNVDMYDIFY